MNKIHPSAIVSSKAIIGKNVEIGPYAVVFDDVKIGDDCIIGPNAVIYDGARLGNRVKVFQGASVANQPQDLKFSGEKTNFFIGDDTTIREFVTLHRGTKETGFSQIGQNCLIMAYAHVAHDCIVGDNCIIANSVQIGGHVNIDDWVIIGGNTPVHQFGIIGQHAMIGGGFRVTVDIPPFVLAANEPLRFIGLNSIGLRRRGFSNEDIMTLKDAYKIIYDEKLNFSQALGKLKVKYPDSQLIKIILDFFEKSTRSVLKK